MIINQVSIELTLPPAIKGFEETHATMTFRPNEPSSTRVFLQTTDLNIEQLQIIQDFIARLSLFGEKAKELADNLVLRK